IEREVQDRQGCWYALRIRPYRTRENQIEGAVIVLSDIDAMRRALAGTLGMIKQPLAMLGADLKVRGVNSAFLDAFGLTAAQIDGKAIFDAADGQFDIPNLRLLLEDVLPKSKEV